MNIKLVMLIAMTMLIFTGCQDGDKDLSGSESISVSEDAISGLNSDLNDNDTDKEAIEDEINDDESCVNHIDNCCEIIKSDEEKYVDLVTAMNDVCTMNETLTYLDDIHGILMLASDDEMIYEAYLNSYETDGITLVSANTTYEIGSVTKQFTAASILKLVEEGELSLDDTLDRFFPEYSYGSQITIDNLLRMQSGIPDYINDMDRFFYGITSEEESDMYNDKLTDEVFLYYLYLNDLEFEPGMETKYSNTNYHILALIIEQLTGKSYAEYIGENIFSECGMSNSSSQTIGDVTSSIDNAGQDGYFTLQNFTRGAMDIHSNAKDLLLFEKALFNGNLLSEEMTEYLFEMEIGDYNCGWIKIEEGIYYHTGSTINYSCVVCVIKSEEFGNIYMLQLYPNKNSRSYMDAMMDKVISLL